MKNHDDYWEFHKIMHGKDIYNQKDSFVDAYLRDKERNKRNKTFFGKTARWWTTPNPEVRPYSGYIAIILVVILLLVAILEILVKVGVLPG